MVQMKPVAAAPLAVVNSKAVTALPAMSGTVQVVPAHRHINTLVPVQDILAATERPVVENTKVVFVLLAITGMVQAANSNVVVLINTLAAALAMPAAQARPAAANIRHALVQAGISGRTEAV